MSLINSILLYSKYSDNCKYFFESVSRNNLSEVLQLQYISIDNKNIREKIKNSVISINFVPCLLQIFSNGKIEKYEGDNLTNWLSTIISQTLPQRSEIAPRREKVVRKLPAENFEENLENLENIENLENPENAENLGGLENVENIENLENNEDASYMRGSRRVSGIKRTDEDDDEFRKNREEYERRKSIIDEGLKNFDTPEDFPELPEKKKVKKERKKKKSVRITDLEDNDMTEDNITARHRQVPQPRRLKQNDNKYIEDDELFAGEILENRKEPRGSVRIMPGTQKGMSDPHGTLAKARELEMGRERIVEFEKSHIERPLNPRRPN